MTSWRTSWATLAGRLGEPAWNLVPLASLKDRPLRVTVPPVSPNVEQLDLAALRARASAELARRGRA